MAVSIATIPAGLHAYPVSLTLRFMIASAVAFALFFAVAASTPKAAGAILGAITSLFVVAFLLSATSIEFNLLGHVADFVFSGLGPLSVFTGRWMLVDA